MTRRYRNAPVREALCEIYFTGSKWDDTTQGMFFERIKEEYPTKQPVTEVGVEVKVERSERGAIIRETQSRMRYLKPDGSRLIQLAPDLLVVNQLRPYPHFDEWRPIVNRMAQIYSEVAAPRMVRQIGVRYINDIHIPSTGDLKLEDYFTVYPQIPPTMGGRHGPYMLRLEMPASNKGHALFITFAMNPAKGADMLSFTLDLYDIFGQAFDYSIQEIEKRVKEAHDEIEPVFEKFIMNKLRELFGGRE